jgi:hypothetical protein
MDTVGAVDTGGRAEELNAAGPATDPHTGRSRRLPGLAVASAASIGAGAVHAAAAGIHSEHVGLTRLFIGIALAQLVAGLIGLVRPTRVAALGILAANAVAVGGWITTRVAGVSFIEGLETRESIQFADGACAALGTVAAAAALAALLVGWRPAPPPRMLFAGLASGMLAVPAMFTATIHLHAGSDRAHSESAAGAATNDGHAHDDSGTETVAATDGDHGHGTAVDNSGHAHSEDSVPVEAGSAPWPRPWDPAEPLDLTGVVGVSDEQMARATKLVEDSLRELPKFATPADATAAGYVSIGDAGTGSEHFIRHDLVEDDVMLDATAPESLVFSVAENGSKTLAGAMYIASARPTDDPTLTEWAGPLMQWHNHGNLCWDRSNGVPRVVGVTRDDGTCARGVNSGGENPMVHVWVTPHPCGVFAALEGTGAGQAAVPEAERVDMCSADQGGGADHGGDHTQAVAKPYDPTQPIDLSGTPGVTPEQQAAAENLIAITLHYLPQWADYKVAEAAGFSSIGDGSTGHEHFIQWDWINDDIILDPNYPESLVYEPQPDGSRKLVSAMYMLPDSVALADAPDIGGALMQWHIHDNLCFTTTEPPRVAGFTDGEGLCRAPLVKFAQSPMIHVWLTAQQCGPFASLEGVGAGQVEEGQERLCDNAHGA